MASPVQFIYSCYLAWKQTQTHVGWMDEGPENILTCFTFLLSSTFTVTFYLNFLLRFMFPHQPVLRQTCAHTHTRTHWLSGVMTSMILDETKGLWLLYNGFDHYQRPDVYSICCVNPLSSPASPPNLPLLPFIPLTPSQLLETQLNVLGSDASTINKTTYTLCKCNHKQTQRALQPPVM